MKYLKKFKTNQEYETSFGELIRPNVSYCANTKDVFYNPIQYFYVRSNLKTSNDAAKIRYTEGMKCNIMDYLVSGTTYCYPYCGYALIENTNVTDNAIPNPRVSQCLTESPYSFTPQPNKTYVLMQQTINSAGLLYVGYKSVFHSSTKVLNAYYLHFFVPKGIKNAGMKINGVDYSATSEDSTKKVKASSSFTINSTKISRANSLVIYLDILSLLKQGSDLEIEPYMVTMDDVKVESNVNRMIKIKDGADVASLLNTDVSISSVSNSNYPNFINPQSE